MPSDYPLYSINKNDCVVPSPGAHFEPLVNVEDLCTIRVLRLESGVKLILECRESGSASRQPMAEVEPSLFVEPSR